MPRAILKSQLSDLVVDKESRVATGLKLLQNNRDVTYAGSDGKPVGFRTNDGLIDGLIQHAGNRSIPAHLTHEWTKGEKDPLSFRVGTFKNLRRDGSGDLLGDFHAMPGVEGDKMLWLADNDRENAALSLVFDYNAIKSDGATFAYPLSFDSADFVAKGAACAMLSQLQNETDMTKEEIVSLIKENAASKDDVTAAVKAALADFKPAGLITSEDADKRVKAALSEYKPTLTAEQIASIGVAAEASLVAKLGAGPLLQNITRANAVTDQYKATLKKFEETHPNRASAIRAMLTKHPELGAAHEENLQLEIAKLHTAA